MCLGLSECFEKEKFIFVFQDVCGKFMFEGEFVNMCFQDVYKCGKKVIDDVMDIYDIIEWLVNNLLNNNGCVGMWGMFYFGYYMLVGFINSYFVLKVILFQVFIVDWFFDDFYCNGVFVIFMVFIFFDFFDK